MYKKEAIIGGVLCIQSVPNGEFKPMSAEQLTKRISELEKELEKRISVMETEKNTLLNALNRIQSVYDWQEDFAGKTAHEVLIQFDYSFNENGSIVSE